MRWLQTTTVVGIEMRFGLFVIKNGLSQVPVWLMSSENPECSRLMVWTPPAINGFAMGQGCVSNIRKARSDCHESQLLRKVSEIAHRVHRLWDRLKRPACGLVRNVRAPVVHAGHGDLHDLLVLIMAFSISSKQRMVATVATLELPRFSGRCWACG
jgi:hypothetical protein